MTISITGVFPSGGVGIRAGNLPPVWSTDEGQLLSISELTVVNEAVLAIDPDDDTVTYSISSGSLPGGLSLNVNTGSISGTASDVGSTTEFFFTIRASDGLLSATRDFSIEIQDIPEGSEVFNVSGSFTHTVASGVTSIEAKCWGGGGGAGKSGNLTTNRGGNGGGGGFGSEIFSVTPSQSLSVKVGGGGCGGHVLGGAGGGGGRSSIGQVIGAGGGGGGRATTSLNEYGGNGGAGGGSTGITGTGGPNGFPRGGNGGTQSAGGGGGPYANAGTSSKGGNGAGSGATCGGYNGGGFGQFGGGGGHGKYGGGGGGKKLADNKPGGGGGGGSSKGTTKISGSGRNAGNTGDSDYASSAGRGALRKTTSATPLPGNPGRVVVNWGPGI